MVVSTEPGQEVKTLHDLARVVGRYDVSSFVFVRDGLEFAARTVHGALSPAQIIIYQYMTAEDIDLTELFERYRADALDETVSNAIEDAGEMESLNRNVGGDDLCWRLRDFARQRYGRLSGLVLGQWGVRETRDFGEIVFAMVDHGFMQKEPQDSLRDFEGVFCLKTELETRYPFFD